MICPLRTVAAALATVGLAACEPTVATTNPRSVAPAAPLRALSSGTPLERFLPLVGGHVYQYAIDTEIGARGLLPVKIERVDERHGAWLLPGGGNVFEYRDDGIVTDGDQGPTYVLKAPLAVGKRWPGGRRSTIEVKQMDRTVRVPAGEWSGCIVTEEVRGGDVPLRITATFCPEVGMVERRVVSGDKEERLTLKSFGPPVELGPDGLRVLRDEE